LRRIFVKIEALVFKCVHIKLKNQSSDYQQTTETYDAHLKRLVDASSLSGAQHQLAKELNQTRCQFAHSLRWVDDITFRSRSLRESWGSNGTRGGRHPHKRYFLPDAFEFSETLLKIFKPVQASQIDGPLFLTALRAAIQAGGYDE
jgi:hypothetical protein